MIMVEYSYWGFNVVGEKGIDVVRSESSSI